MKRTYKNIQSIAKNTNQLTLQGIINKQLYFNSGVSGWNGLNYELKDTEINQIVDLLGGNYKTKEKIKRTIKYKNPNFWGLSRIIFSAKRNKFEYCAGQDYPEELKQIRKYLKNY